MNQGFSRKPARPFFDQEKNILVLESIGSTIYHSKNGNNTVFHIREFYIDPKGKELMQTSWDIFEGTDRLANETAISYQNIAPYTFREEMGDGEYCLYTALFSPAGAFIQLKRTFFNKDGSLHSQDILSGP